MAIVHFVKNRRTQTVGGLRGVLNYCCKAAKVDYEGRPLVTGINCVPQCAIQEFMNTKEQYHRTGGRMYYHMVQSFHPDDPVIPEMAHEIALKLAEQIPGFEIVVATHTDRNHVHSHFVINSVSCDTGKSTTATRNLSWHSGRLRTGCAWSTACLLWNRRGSRNRNTPCLTGSTVPTIRGRVGRWNWKSTSTSA